MDYLSALAQQNARVAVDAGATRQRALQAADQTQSLEAAASQALDQLRRSQSQMGRAVGAQRRLINRLGRRLKREVAMAVAQRLRARQAAAAAAAAAAPDPGSPAPTGPAPTGPAPPPENIYSIWGHGADGRVAECIADHESGDNPNNRNAGSGAAGLFQLMPFWWDGNNAFGWKFDPYDGKANAEHAYLIWKRDGWSPWTTRPLCT